MKKTFFDNVFYDKFWIGCPLLLLRFVKIKIEIFVLIKQPLPLVAK